MFDFKCILERAKEEVQKNKEMDFYDVIEKMLDDEQVQAVKKLMLEQPISEEHARIIVSDEIIKFYDYMKKLHDEEDQKEEEELRNAEKKLLENEGPKCVYIHYGGEFEPTKEQAVFIARSKIKIQSQFFMSEIVFGKLDRNFFASEVEMDRARAQQIIASLDTDLYSSPEVETIVCDFTPFDIRI